MLGLRREHEAGIVGVVGVPLVIVVVDPGAQAPPRPLMNGSVTPSKEEPPPSAANATSRTTTRPSTWAAGGKTRGVTNRKFGRFGGFPTAEAYPTTAARPRSGDPAQLRSAQIPKVSPKGSQLEPGQSAADSHSFWHRSIPAAPLCKQARPTAQSL